LNAALVPDPKVKAALVALNLTNEMLVHPGVSVTLQVDLPDDIRQKVTDDLKASLQKNGVTVAEGQPVKLVASTEEGKEKEITYAPWAVARLPGNVPNSTKVNVHELVYHLRFVADDGGTIWEHSST